MSEREKLFQTAADCVLSHRIRIPDAASSENRVPVVVMSHGWGGNEDAMWIFSRLVPQSAAVVTPRAPLDVPGTDGKRAYWFDYVPAIRGAEPHSFAKAVSMLKQFILCLPDFYPIDSAKVFLAGFSQGAMVSNALAMSEPQMVRGVASLAGAALPLPDALPRVSALARLPVFIAHGTQDQMVPLISARETKAQYEQLGADVTYGEYPVAHKMSSDAMKDLQVWFETILQKPDSRMQKVLLCATH